ncbi:MAG TPA: hypothetical protein VIR78_13965 [Malonomonas sp.]
MKNIIRNTLIVLAGFSTTAHAAAEAGGEGGSFLLTLFIGFFALIIVFQLIPAVLLFAGMLKGLFVREHKAEKPLN